MPKFIKILKHHFLDQIKKKSLNIIKSKRPTENASKKNNNYNMNLHQKTRRQRNYKTHKEPHPIIIMILMNYWIMMIIMKFFILIKRKKMSIY